MLLALACGCLLAATTAHAADVPFRLPPGERIASPAEPGAIHLYEGPAPGNSDIGQREVWEQTAGGREARNVTDPVLLPVLPRPGKANGTAVIVAPGGGFRGLSMDNEGFAVANMLAMEGVTVFVLKYRLIPTAQDRATFANELAGIIERREPLQAPSYAVDDGRRAVRLVRERAAAFGLRADRIGLVGFSAGAMLTLEVSLSPDKANRPDFAGIIYGQMPARSVPADAPPAFMALASNDFFANGDYGLVGAWQKAGSPVEFHLYGAGGHGFGMRKQGTTSDLWWPQLLAWMRMRGQL
jgi:acetyl esterase/lipase